MDGWKLDILTPCPQVQRLRVHAQTDYVRKFIKEFFTPNFHNKF